MFGNPEYSGTRPHGRTRAPGIFREPHDKGFNLILCSSILTIYLFFQGDFDQMAGTIPVVLHDVFLILAVSVMLLLSL